MKTTLKRVKCEEKAYEVARQTFPLASRWLRGSGHQKQLQCLGGGGEGGEGDTLGALGFE